MRCGEEFYLNRQKRVRPIRSQKIQRLAAYLGVTTANCWGKKKILLTYPTRELAEITAIFNQLTPENRAKLLELSRMYLSAQRKRKRTIFCLS
jgi:hypothetical protein